jgi:hypothetical protein
MREKALAWGGAHTWEKAYEVTRDALVDAWRESLGAVAETGSGAEALSGGSGAGGNFGIVGNRIPA